MSPELEERLERVADSLPDPTDAARTRARSTALAALSAQRPRSRPRRRRFRFAAAAVGAAAVATLVAVLLPWGGDSPLATEQALAALGDQPVIHAIVEHPFSTVVDLGSGEGRPELHRSEYWYDGERELLHTRFTLGGELVMEFLQSSEGMTTDTGPVEVGPGPPWLDPALTDFATRYREALESGRARVIGKDVVDGRDAVVLRITGGRDLVQDVAVDAEDYRPLRFRARYGPEEQAGPWATVAAIETIARDPQDFAPPRRSEPRPASEISSPERSLTPEQAATALAQPALWAGDALDGIPLKNIELVKLTSRWTDGRDTETRYLELVYGPAASQSGEQPSLTLTEAAPLSQVPFFGRRGFAGPPLDQGQLRLIGVGDWDGSEIDMWFGSVLVDGVYVTLQSVDRDLILTAAGTLKPIG